MSVSVSGLVVGGGSIGRRHIRNLQQIGVEVAVLDRDPRVLDDVSSTFDVQTYSSYARVHSEQSPDFCLVATPNSSHVSVAMEAAEAGCHLFIEKPVSHKMNGVSELEALISERNLVSLVGCNFRFHPELKKVKELLEADAIGNVVAARIEGGSYLPQWVPKRDYRESYSAREDLGGGVILDYIHEINYARWFFGEFDTVSAIAGQRTHLDIETDDVASIQAITNSDITCQFHFDYVQRPYSRSCHIIGEQGTIRWSWSDESVQWYQVSDEEWRSYSRPDGWKVNDMYVKELKHFVTCVESGVETVCPVSSGRRDLAVALAARHSAQTGRHVSTDEIS
ncbi:Gfo/Idh/MocA family protein [Natrarchaeobius sp. A-rgal3]|uniref:Gfo/Idh/MocA family protein n=1 Tax=Natrarchaeobius versutus TaxID=1679078 RepID=UPI00351091F0